MISHISGILRKKDDEELSVEVDVNGVWYEVQLPRFVWETVKEADLGSPIELETLYYVAEHQPIPKLVGFTRDVEREFFKKFIGVPRVGTSTALKAMAYSVSVIARWIENGDTSSLKSLPEIGPRTAETIVASLRGKVMKEALLQDEGFDTLPEAEPEPTLEEAKREAIEGLVHLQFGRGEADRIVTEIVKDEALRTAEEIIMAVFKRRGQPR